MVYVFFIYGLAFFALGLSLALYPKKDSSFWFAGKLNYIAAFGLLHGLNEWIDMFILIHGVGGWFSVQVLRTALMGSSFLCLIIFGVSSVIRTSNGPRALFVIPTALLGAWLIVIVTGGDQRFLLSDVLGRYILGAPGIFITVYALRMVDSELVGTGLKNSLFNLRLAAAFLFIYGILSGLVVPRADFFPATVLNYDVFREHLGFPVQVLRSVCAVVIAYSMFRVLQVFDWESKSEIIRARDEMEVRVEERTEDLVETNMELESEIAERTRAELFIKKILETVDEAFVVIDPEYRIVMANRAYCEQTKWPFEEIVGAHCHQVSHSSPVPCFEAGEDCAVKNVFEKSVPYSTLHVHKDREGNDVYVETNAFPLKDPSGKVVQVIETINDITEKRKLEDQLRQSQKMQAIGTLTGGIAHDFNNLLTTILGYGEFLQDDLDKGSSQKTYADFIVAAANRAARLTQSLLAFSRKQITKPEIVSVESIFNSVNALLTRIIGEDVELHFPSGGDDHLVKVDRGQLEQVLINLVSNAKDAMPGGGEITLNSELVSIDEAFITAHGYGRPGGYCLISVRDEGIGMDENTREQVFEPFFTTKDVGKGTGLGLSVVYGIIKQNGGYIDVYSESGHGTEVRMYLPVSGSLPEQSALPVYEAVEGGFETILVVEDSDSIREFLKTVLVGAGYRPIIAGDGDEAMRLLRESPDDIELLLLDVIMPKMNGKDVYDEAKLIRKDIKAIFISGYSEDIIHKKGLLLEGLHFIQKPISPKVLLKEIRDILDS